MSILWEIAALASAATAARGEIGNGRPAESAVLLTAEPVRH